MNAHTISGIELIPSTLFGRDYCDISPRNFHLVTEVNLIFSAIYPKTSILNHSCNENARNFFNGRTLRMFAQCNIPKNAEVSNSYGPSYKSEPTSVRQSLLMERYHFQCNCEKCTTNDGTYDVLSHHACSNESCKSQFKLDNIGFQWWDFDVLEDLRLSSEIMPLFRCKICYKMQKLNPEGLKKYFNQVRTAKDENVKQTDRVNCLEDAAYYYLESVTCLAIGHELRLAMAEAILSLDMFDLGKQSGREKSQNNSIFIIISYFSSVAERDVTIPLALVAADFCKNVIRRFGIYSLEYFKSLTYAVHLLNLIAPDNVAFREMIENSVDIKHIYKYIHILPERMQALYKHVLNKVCIHI